MSLLQKSNKRVSAREQIRINGVRDGILMLPHNEYRTVLAVSSLNFELKSEEEQDAIIETYQSFINSLNTPIQIIVRVREVNMDGYLDEMDQRKLEEPEAIYRTQLDNYADFVRGLVETNKILTRQFYVVIPYKEQKGDFEVAREQLNVLSDIVGKGLMRLGMHSRELTSLEVLDLFYSFYNPAAAKHAPIRAAALKLLHTGYVQKEAI